MTTGEGGAVYTSNDELASIAESIRDWGRDCYCQPGRSNTCGKRFGWSLGTLPEGYDHKYTYSHFGYNLKMTDMQAAVGVAQLKKLPSFVAARRRNFDYLHQRLARFSEVLRLPEPTPHSTPSWFGFLAVVKPGTSVTRDSLVGALEKARVQTRMLFAGNLVRQPCFDEMRATGTGFRQVGELPNTDRLMNDAFWFGVYPGMTEAHLDHICSTIEQHFGRRTTSVESCQMSGLRGPTARAVLFDLDGTLVDTFPGIASAYRHVLTQMGLDDMDDVGLRALIGPPIQEGLHRYLGLSGDRLDEGIRIFREHYGSEWLVSIRQVLGGRGDAPRPAGPRVRALHSYEQTADDGRRCRRTCRLEGRVHRRGRGRTGRNPSPQEGRHRMDLDPGDCWSTRGGDGGRSCRRHSGRP